MLDLQRGKKSAVCNNEELDLCVQQSNNLHAAIEAN